MNEVTLRDYFAAHAPSEPQPWFRPIMPPYPERAWTGRDQKTGETLRFTGRWAAQSACGDDHWDANQEARAMWSAQFSMQTFIQWPYAWADKMIEARNAQAPK